MNFSTRALKVPLDNISQLNLPAVLHWDMRHFVVLKSASKKKFVVHDPAVGERQFTKEEFSDHFSGVALELTPTASFEQKTDTVPLKFSSLWGKIYGLKSNIIKLFVLSVILQLFVLVSPFYLQFAVDNVVPSLDENLLIILALGFGGLALFSVVTSVLRDYIVIYFSSFMSYQLVVNLFNHLIYLPTDYFEKRHVGDIVSRFGSVDPVKKMIVEGLISAILDGLMTITTLAVMFVFSPLLATISLTAWLLYCLLRFALFRPFYNRQQELIVAQATESTTFLETIRGIISIKIFAAESVRQRMWQNRFANSISKEAHLAKLGIWFNAGEKIIFGLEHVIWVYVAIIAVMDGDITVGMIFAIMAYKNNFIGKATAVVNLLIEFKLLDLHLERISDIYYTETENKENELTVFDGKTIDGSIDVVNLSYSYGLDQKDVLSNVSVNIEAGSSVVIVGASGCGKTTLLKLMTGLIKPTKGHINIDGENLTSYSTSEYRNQIGVLMQNDDLFEGSVIDNISFFDVDIDQERVETAAKAARIHDDIMAMAMKYETLVGDMGSALSGGQKQRVMLARALYKNPKILFMDEGTAHLDVYTEGLVNESIVNLGITRIVVAHRPETIKMAERILEIKDGILTEITEY
jgi:ATP-binding cassette subfamily B protein RaxB